VHGRSSEESWHRLSRTSALAEAQPAALVAAELLSQGASHHGNCDDQ
jgi:hypothetical protein